MKFAGQVVHLRDFSCEAGQDLVAEGRIVPGGFDSFGVLRG